ncbi:CUGBP Elav-like family member 2 isoform X1 [Contarinia nasturtii]|uniref:CUGBP Elav-like family member 2 isoform X1 n=1 Tax=Contarinia nasturtii TaxID=265458 RepID=UPI0012D39297|nr:CUGBP Elav-like family member 2 isoform X1 [Contarinia nasturtii]
MIHHTSETENMLSSLDTLAEKISPGSGKSSPNQQSNDALGTTTTTTTITSSANNIGQRTHFSQSIHPYQKVEQNNNNTSSNNNNNNNNHNHNSNLVRELNNHNSSSTSPTININNANNAVSVAAINNNNNNNVLNNNNLNGSPEGLCTNRCEQPDPDFIKMFVGQVPKSMDEDQLREMFEEFGRVHSINVLRDKVTGVSKGCCFVTFFTRKAALNAQDALHNVKTLAGMHHPIQMKPADSENRNERKLFVGMLNKKLNEADVRKLFEKHGPIEECTVLRDQNAQSKGCAFVTFSSKQAAIGAIKGLHQSHTMDGCSAPIVVKFADTQKEKEQKKMQQMQANLWNLAAANMNIGTTTAPSTPSILPNPPQQSSPILAATESITPASLHLLQQLQAVGLQQQILQGLNTQSAESTAAAAAAGLLPPMNIQSLAALAAMTQPSIPAATTAQPSAPLTNAATLLCLLGKTANTGTDPNLAAAYVSAGLPQFATSALSTSALGNVSLQSTAGNALVGKQIEDAANLFIYHLPQEFTDTDLASTFLPFGTVISAKVFIDKQTNLSKCFGFVSYDNHESAQAAIKAMHGFQIGTKRLKVQLKKPKDASKPY